MSHDPFVDQTTLSQGWLKTIENQIIYITVHSSKITVIK